MGDVVNIKKKIINCISLNKKNKNNYFFNNGNNRYNNFIINKRICGKFNRVKNISRDWSLNHCSQEERNLFYKQFIHPQIQISGTLRGSLGAKVPFTIWNSITTDPYSLKNENITIKESFADTDGTIIKGSYFNVSNYSISNYEYLLDLRPNTIKLIDYKSIIENDISIQEKISLNIEKKIEIIRNNDYLLKNIDPNTSFIINQHFENCSKSFNNFCYHCIFIEEKYGIVNILGEYI